MKLGTKTITTIRIALMTIFGLLLVMQPALDYGHYREAFVDLRTLLSTVGFIMVITAITYATRKIRFSFKFEELKNSKDANAQAMAFLAVCLFEAAVVIAAAILAK